jgi:hypothetical protein
MFESVKRRAKRMLRLLGKAAFSVSPALELRLKYADLSDKSTYATKVAQRNLFMQYRMMAEAGGKTLPSIDDTGYRIYSECDEDGIFVFLFAVIGTHSKTFVDIGSADGINSNCANLAINFGWHGLFIDSNPQRVARGERFYNKHSDTFLYPPKFVCAMVKRANINQLITSAGFCGEIDLLSIDIDGNDYWVWDALECVQPRVVCIETNIEFGYRNIVVPYDEDWVYPGVYPPDYLGASPVAMLKLAERRGYRLIGANIYGFNTIYIRNDIAPNLIPARTVEEILCHPRNQGLFKQFEAIKDMPYVQG